MIIPAGTSPSFDSARTPLGWVLDGDHLHAVISMEDNAQQTPIETQGYPKRA